MTEATPTLYMHQSSVNGRAKVL